MYAAGTCGFAGGPNEGNAFLYRYPEYEIIGDGKMAKTPEEQRPDSDQSIRNIVTDVHFLSRCDYVVCAFPSDVRYCDFIF